MSSPAEAVDLFGGPRDGASRSAPSCESWHPCPMRVLRSAIGSLPIPVIILDRAKAVVLANDAACCILDSPASPPGRPLAKLGIILATPLADAYGAELTLDAALDFELRACGSAPSVRLVDVMIYPSESRGGDLDLNFGQSDIKSAHRGKASVSVCWDDDGSAYFILSLMIPDPLQGGLINIPRAERAQVQHALLTGGDGATPCIAFMSPPPDDRIESLPLPRPESPASKARKIRIINDAILKKSEMPLMAVWKDRSVFTVNRGMNPGPIVSDSSVPPYSAC